MSVDFRFWGEYELLYELAKNEHRGRVFFWFHQEFFDREWLSDRIAESIANAGPRYTPELNVELPISNLFDGLGRTPNFYNKLWKLYGDFRRRYEHCSGSRVPEISVSYEEFQKYALQTFGVFDRIKQDGGAQKLDFSSLMASLSKVSEAANKCLQELDVAISNISRLTNAETKTESEGQRLKFLRDDLYKLRGTTAELSSFGNGKEAALANLPFLLLTGGPGTGKTHLLCDAAKARAGSSLPTILLLGEHFTSDEPWSQIVKLLGLTCSRDEFLGALNAAAQAQNSRALIFIDALNEGARQVWLNHFAGMLATLSRYPWIGLCVSVRSSYESIVIPVGLVPARLLRVRHNGFADHEFEAATSFFDHYGIQHPTVPFLAPEFQNPLFLKVFCEALRNKGLTRIPRGVRGITSLLEFYLDSINDKLARPEQLNFDPQSRIVHAAVEKLAQLSAEKGTGLIDRDVARKAIDRFLSSSGYDSSLFARLIREGLLAEDRIPDETGTYENFIHFAYERFSDHLVLKFMLSRYLDSASPGQSFAPGTPLGDLIKDEQSCRRNRGLVDALSVQIPEIVGRELADVAPHCAAFNPVREAFVQSLIWRNVTAINAGTLQYINRRIVPNHGTRESFLDVLLTIAAFPDHPYNARFLHTHLLRCEMPERDAWWSIYVHQQYGEHGAIDRLLHWALSPSDKSAIESDSIELSALALSWFLTTSNRYLRDRATKALVSLLTPHIEILRNFSWPSEA